VTDASQALVVWTIDKRIVNEELAVHGTSLEAWDVGEGKTPVVLSALDQREGDLRAHRELVVGCLVAPRNQPLAVGLWPLGEAPVSTDLAKVASETIWGYEKTLASEIRMILHERSVKFELWEKLDPASDPVRTVELTVPRGGESYSLPLPVLSYTLKRTRPKAPGFLHRTLIARAGQEEQVRGGGAGVTLSVSKGRPEGLGDTLRRLRLVDAAGKLAQAPQFTVWTEKMTADVGPPALVVTTADEES
jgi:hypothetical protein